MITLFLISGCSRQEDIVEIKDVAFRTQIDEIYLNTKDYMGKTIKLEGIFKKEQSGGQEFYYVIRYSPGGCCGTDGWTGFMVRWNEKNYPEPESWVEAIGVLNSFWLNGNPQLYLDLSSLSVLNKRGMEFVIR